MPKVKSTEAPKGEGKLGHKSKKRQQQEDDDATEEDLAVPIPESPKVAKSPKSPKKPAAKKAVLKQKKKAESEDETEEEEHGSAKKAKKHKSGLEGGKGGKGAKSKNDEEGDESDEGAGKRGAEEAEGQPKKKKPKVKATGKVHVTFDGEEEYPTLKLPKVDYVQPYLVNLGGIQDEPVPKKSKNAKNGKPAPPPGAPGPVPRAWELYAKDKYDMVQEEYPNFKRGEVIAELKKRWNAAEDLEKEVYLDHQEEEVRRYRKEYFSFVKKNPGVYIHPPPKCEREEMSKEKKEGKKSPKKPKAEKKEPKAKKEGKSKRPKSGYNLFVEAEIKKWKAENEDVKLNMGELMKTFGSKWESLPAKEKQSYQDKAKKAKDEWIAGGGPEQAKEERKKKKEMVAVKGKAHLKVKYPQCLRSAYQFWLHKNKESFNESYRAQGIPKKQWPANLNDFWNKMEEECRQQEDAACAAVKDAYASRMMSLPEGPRVWMYEKRDNVWRQVDEGAGAKLTKALNEMKQFIKLRLHNKQATVDLQNMTFVFKKRVGAETVKDDRRIMCCVVARGEAMPIPAPPKTPRAGKKGKTVAESDGEESEEEEVVKREEGEESDENEEE
eukprot:comp24328_c0_seq1/m.45978 comp24328_c0_seq1/g.45978  ORF comp24328_c0_seq1/g.45978 comp24328_c0_seq1/m.45978 type:complete len:608 (-) comp24328_c0_seq1:152-1975(-)